MRAQLLRSLGRLQPIRGRPAIQCGKRLRSNDGDVTIAIKAMRDITSGHLRSSGGTKHLCLGLLGTLWFTRGRLPQVQATLQSVSITLSYFFHLLGLFGPLQPERRHFPSVWGLLSVDSAAGLLRGGISSDQCHCGRPKTVVARHIFRGSGFIHKEFIMSPLTSITNFRHFHSFLASYSKIPTLCVYFERFLPGPMDTLGPGKNIV